MRNPISNLHRFSKKTKNQSINKDTQILILRPIYDIYRRIFGAFVFGYENENSSSKKSFGCSL